MKTSGNTILITGGGSGIGRELARRFNDLGNDVIVAGRRRDALDETIAGRTGMHAIELDVESAESIAAFARTLIAEHPRLNVVINNAGMMRTDDLTRGDGLNGAEETIVTNLLGPIRLNAALVDHLGTQPDAAIVNVSSGLAFVPLMKAPIYSASKAAIHSYTVSLREQLRGSVEVIELAPPAVQTGLTPGQSTREGYMPLQDYIDEVMGLFATTPTPAEILVERVKPLRFAEAEGRYGDVLAMLKSL
ncbi:SDR family oxidoreductase [Sphingomonas montanisoli]|uniref:SDR family NAD(P)-dependent oxidoreductase n=1 Tax=Sphingomonas montanisoli TaxID=2606412 RepID=A0A5D9CCH3_9SPHN|nr:SDR family oxidoreductase [Sphingomonas montanisoli]TZG28842.1 SDR family NAD(P)-dependent oxidoreductase [Sphingomonas montanisoli]